MNVLRGLLYAVVAGEVAHGGEVSPELDLLGYTREEYIGRHISEFHADREAIEDILARLTRDETLHSYEARLRRKDGSVRHVLISSNVRRRGGEFVHTRCFTRDITERRRADALLGGQNRVLELMAQGAPLPEVLDALVRAVEAQSTEGVLGSILLLDGEGRRLRHGAAPSLPEGYNRAIDGVGIGPAVGSCGTAAYTGEQVVVTDISADPLRADFKDLAAEHGLRACWSTPIFSISGRVLGTFAMYYREPRAPAGHDLQLISMVTRTAAIAIERKQAEEALRRSEQRHRLAMRATHDVVWDWDMARDEVYWSESLHTVFGYPPEVAGVAIGDAFSWWTSLIHPEDRGRVGESFERAAKSGQTEWFEEYRFLRADGTYAEVSDAAFIVFDRFRQADGSTTKQFAGLGLGLAIVRHLAELHGGSVRAESEGTRRGAIFTVILPVAPISQSADVAGRARRSAGAALPPYESPDRLDGLHLLVVEDEPDTREMLKAGLERCGASVTTASSAAEALAELSRSKPDVLVSDIGMPGEDGYALLRRVGELPTESGGRVPAIALTADARVEDRMQALRAGYQMHVTKPVEPAELAAVLASLAQR